MSATVRFYDVEPTDKHPALPAWATVEPGHHGLHETPQIGDEVRLAENQQDEGHWWRVIRRSHRIGSNSAQHIVVGVRFVS